MGGALDGIGYIRNYRLEGRIVDEGTAERVGGLVVLLRVESGDVRFSIFRHCFDTSIQFDGRVSVRETASCHPASNRSRSAICIFGLNTSAPFTSASISSGDFHIPTARPASIAAPIAVVSAIFARRTGLPRISAWNCIR